METKRVLVPGGGGYIGSRLVPALLAAGYEVTVIDTFWFGNHLQAHPRLRIVQRDLREPVGVEGCDAVIHLACVSNDPSCELNPAVAKEINVGAFRRFMDSAVAARIPRFVYASSSSVYGVCAAPATEEQALEPLTDYSRHKVECEQMVEESGLPYVIVRPATACGVSPRMRFDTMLNSFVNQAMNFGGITVRGGAQMRSHIHIDDLVRFYLLALDSEAALGGTFNVSTDSMSILALAEMIRRTVKCALHLTTSNDKRSYQVDATRAAEQLEFVPFFPIPVAIGHIFRAMPLFTDPLENPAYFNLKRMKEIYA